MRAKTENAPRLPLFKVEERWLTIPELTHPVPEMQFGELCKRINADSRIKLQFASKWLGTTIPTGSYMLILDRQQRPQMALSSPSRLGVSYPNEMVGVFSYNEVYVRAGNTHILNIPADCVAKAWVDNHPSFYAPGLHIIRSKNFRFNATRDLQKGMVHSDPIADLYFRYIPWIRSAGWGLTSDYPQLLLLFINSLYLNNTWLQYHEGHRLSANLDSLSGGYQVGDYLVNELRLMPCARGNYGSAVEVFLTQWKREVQAQMALATSAAALSTQGFLAPPPLPTPERAPAAVVVDASIALLR